MSSRPHGRLQSRRLLTLTVVVACFAAGLVTAGAMAGAGPLSALTSLASSESIQSDTTVSDAPGTEPTPTGTTSSTDTASTEPTSTDTSSAGTTESTTTAPTETTSGPPAIASDQPDYNPGATVILTGTNWAAAEVVHLFVNDDLGKTWSYDADVTAGSDGGFTDEFQLPTTFVATYSVTATGAVSGVATTSFTDGNVNVKVTGGPTSASVTWRRHSGTNCTGALTGSPSAGTIVAGDSGNGTSIPSGAAATESLELTAGTVTGFSFQTWSNGSFLPADPSSANPVCLVGAGNTQNVRLNYAAATNHAPAIASDNASVGTTEGSAATNSGTWGDADSGDTVTLTASVGSVTKSGTNLAGTWSWSIATMDGPAGPTTVTITANDGHTTSSTSFTYSVTNAPPTVTAAANQAASVGIAKSFDLGSFSDPGTDNPWAVDVDWGDGTPHTTFNATATGSLGTSSHTYASAGTKTVTVEVTDKDTASDSKTFTVAVSKLDQSISFGALGDKTYGDPDFSVSATASSGLATSFAASGSCAVSGSTVRVTAAGGCTITASQAGNATYNAAPDVPQSFNISKKDVTAAITAADKTYDGGTAADYSCAVVGKVSGDDVDCDGTHPAVFGSKDVGTRTATASGLQLSGGDALDYNLLNTTDSDDAVISALDVNAKITAADKTYDGGTAADYSCAVVGKVSGDDVDCDGTHPAVFGSKDVGTRTATASGLQLSGGDALDYNLLNTTDSDDAVISAKTVSVSFQAQDKVWDGNAAATIKSSPAPTLVGIVGGDAVSLGTGTASASFGSSAVGTWTVTGSGFTKTGADAGDYVFAAPQGTTTASILAWNALGYGFYQPVGVPNSIFTPAPGSAPTSKPNSMDWNTAKGGSTVPLKFNIYAGTVEKTTAAAFPGANLATAFQTTKLSSCTDSTSEDAVDFTTTGNTSLRYDGTGAQWIQNWSTPKVSSDSCYRAWVTFADGSTLESFFKLKR